MFHFSVRHEVASQVIIKFQTANFLNFVIFSTNSLAIFNKKRRFFCNQI